MVTAPRKSMVNYSGFYITWRFTGKRCHLYLLEPGSV